MSRGKGRFASIALYECTRVCVCMGDDGFQGDKLQGCEGVIKRWRGGWKSSRGDREREREKKESNVRYARGTRGSSAVKAARAKVE